MQGTLTRLATEIAAAGTRIDQDLGRHRLSEKAVRSDPNVAPRYAPRTAPPPPPPPSAATRAFRFDQLQTAMNDWFTHWSASVAGSDRWHTSIAAVSGAAPGAWKHIRPTSGIRSPVSG
jgi:hypothetical protein